MDKKERDRVRNDDNLRVVVEDYGYSWDKIIAIIDRADKCDELEKRCEAYAEALSDVSYALWHEQNAAQMSGPDVYIPTPKVDICAIEQFIKEVLEANNENKENGK